MNEFLDVIEAMDEDRLRLQARIKRQRHELRRLNRAAAGHAKFVGFTKRHVKILEEKLAKVRADCDKWEAKEIKRAICCIENEARGDELERQLAEAVSHRDIWFKAASDRLLELTQVKQRLADAERQITELQAKLYGAGI